MNALLVCASPAPGGAALVRDLAPRFDLLIAVDGGAGVCADAGVVPGVLLGDFDSIEVAELDRLTSLGVRIVRFPADKNQTDLELAFDEARRSGVSAVTVTAASGGRLDHTLAVVSAMAAGGDLNPELVEPGTHGWLLATFARDRLALRGQGATVSLLPIGAGARVSATGMRWPLDHHSLPATSTLGVSNIISGDDPAIVTVHSGLLFVLSPSVGASGPAVAL